MVPRKKRSKLWNYFEELKPTLVKCTTCKKEIKVFHPKHSTKLMRLHLSKHGIFLDNDTFSLHDDLKQYYSELSGYKAKCNDCGKTMSFLTNITRLRKHLRRHSTRILSRDEPSSSSLADNSIDSSADRQSQDASDLPIQALKEAIEKTGALNEPSTFSSTAYIMDLSTGKYIPLHQNQEQVPSSLPVQSFKETAENTGVLDEPSTSSSADYVMDPSAEHQSGEPCGFPVQSFEQMTEGTSALHSDWFYYTIPSDSSSTYYVMAPSAEHQSGEQPGLPVQSFEQMTEGTSALHSTDIMAPTRKRSMLWNYFEKLNYSLVKCTTCQKEIKTPNPTRRTKIMRAHILNTINLYYRTITPAPARRRNKLWNYFEELNPSLVKCTTCKKEIKIPERRKFMLIFRVHLNSYDIEKKTQEVMEIFRKIETFVDKVRNLPSTSSLADNSIDPSADRQRRGQTQESLSLPAQSAQSFEQMRKGTSALNKTIKKASIKRRSKLWNYFKELKPLLVKCTICKKEIKISRLSNRIKTFRAHLSIKHGIFLYNDTFTLPDDLSQYYLELSRYKAKCKDCDKTLSFLSEQLVRRKKRSKFWNYFEELKPLLEKCTTCKKEIKIPHPTRRTKIMRAHILNVHGISIDDETVTLPDDLKQYYSELPGHKAKCNNCGKAVSFLTNIENLRDNYKGIEKKTQQVVELFRGIKTFAGKVHHLTVMVPRKKRSKLWNYFEKLKPTLVKCATCTKEIKISRLKEIKIMRIHLSRQTIITAPARKRNKLWNYFEELNPSLVKCTTCKKEIKISHPKNRIIILRTHLFNEHGIYLDDDIRKLPDDLKQYYSKLPGYKAKCNNCGKTKGQILRTLVEAITVPHLISDNIYYRTVIMAQKRKRSKLWNYFEEVNPSLVKCTTCKKEIKIPYPNNSRTIIFRKHLFNKHKIYLDDDIFSLPDDLKEYYSKLPRYKAKCNNCGKTLSFLSNFKNLRRHVKRHSTSIQSPDEPNTSITTGFDTNPTAECQSQESPGLPVQSFEQTRKETSTLDKTIIKPPTRKRSKLWNYFEELKPSLVKTVMVPKKKRSKLWNYFEELKPTLVKCTTCKKEIKIFHPKHSTKLMRLHLSKHGIFLDNDTFSLQDDLKQYYSELSGYKAKCNDCGKTYSFIRNPTYLREHLKRRHSTKIQSQDEPSTSSLPNTMDPSAERQGQDISDLPVQSFKEKAGALNDGSNNIEKKTQKVLELFRGTETFVGKVQKTKHFKFNGLYYKSFYRKIYIPLRQSQKQVPSGLPVQSFKKTAKNIEVLDE
ncbi:hypothetical protein DBV15_04581, partial [Temnothorax longispinosus]